MFKEIFSGALAIIICLFLWTVFAIVNPDIADAIVFMFLAYLVGSLHGRIEQ